MALARGGAALYGTCAGMILLADRIADGDEPVLRLLDITVQRNAYGRQLDSFEADLDDPVARRRAAARGLHPRPGRQRGRPRRRGAGPRPRWPADRRPPGAGAGHRLPPGADRGSAAASAPAGADRRSERRGRLDQAGAPHRPAGAGRPVAPGARGDGGFPALARRAGALLGAAADQPRRADAVVAAAALAIGPHGRRVGGAAGRQLPRHRGAAPRRLGDHRARRGRLADGGRGALRAAAAR